VVPAAGGDARPSDELSIGEVDEILAALPRMSSVRLTGGEPFARKDFWQIEELARRHLRPGSLCVATDGARTERIIKFCDKRDKTITLQLEVSLRSAQRCSTWAESMQTVRILARHLEQFRIRLHVAQAVGASEDLRHYERLRAWLLPFGVQYRLEPLQADVRAVPPSYAATEGRIRLLPNGDVLACHCGVGRVGNLRSQSFAEVWYSDAAYRMRDLAERCPGCWSAPARDSEPSLARATA